MDSIAVGTMPHCIFIAERMGSATVTEQRPKPDISFTIAIEGCFFMYSSPFETKSFVLKIVYLFKKCKYKNKK